MVMAEDFGAQWATFALALAVALGVAVVVVT